MNSLTQQLVHFQLFSEPRVNYMVNDYVIQTTVKLDYDWMNEGQKVHKSYTLTLDQFVSLYKKTPPSLREIRFSMSILLQNLSISFYQQEKLLVTVTHFGLVPSILKWLDCGFEVAEATDPSSIPLLTLEERREKEQSLIEGFKQEIERQHKLLEEGGVIRFGNQYLQYCSFGKFNQYALLEMNNDYNLYFEAKNIKI
jgi:hypothetical protein